MQRNTLYRDRNSHESSDDSSVSSSSASDRKKLGHQQQDDSTAEPSTVSRGYWFRGRSQKNVPTTSNLPPVSNSTLTMNSNETNEADEEHLKEMYQRMLNMTIELIDDICLNLRPGDRVLTSYGTGTVLRKEALDLLKKEAMAVDGNKGNVTISHKIKLDWGGILFCPREDFVHKLLTTEEYSQAMENLEEVRKLQLNIQCIEWRIKPQADEACVACLFCKPELTSSSRRKKRVGYYWRSSSSASSSAADSPIVTIKTKRCDVCGNPVCRRHKIAMDAGDVEFFTMCVDCSHDLNQTELHLNPHHPQLLPNLQRLVHYYKRMRLQLCFCIPNFSELGYQLTYKQKRDGAISLGNSALGFVGAALGVAGAAAMLTPAGPAILLAAVATSATSGTFQSMHASYNKFLSSKTANQIADRCLGWHGLCLGILNALEMLRKDLIVEENDFRLDHLKNSSDQDNKSSKAPSKQSRDILNSLAVSSFSTTRSAMTGVGVTSAMGSTYSQAINTSLLGVPVVGAAFSVGCMAMDANNMAESVKLLRTPAQKAIAIKGVEQSFMRHIPNTIASTVDAIMKAVDDLHLRMAEQRQENERALIQAELEGLGGSLNMDSDSDIERELAGL